MTDAYTVTCGAFYSHSDVITRTIVAESARIAAIDYFDTLVEERYIFSGTELSTFPKEVTVVGQDGVNATVKVGVAYDSDGDDDSIRGFFFFVNDEEYRAHERARRAAYMKIIRAGRVPF